MKPVARGGGPGDTLGAGRSRRRSRMPGLLLAFIAVSALQGLGSAAVEPPPPVPDTDLAPVAKLLDRMNAALRSLDYQGTLVYLVDNRLETLQLVHRVEQGRVEERLVSLSGPVRTVTRERDGVTCVMPDGHPILVKSHARQHLMQARPIDPQALTRHYRVGIVGASRVAGREADVVLILPLDEARYGYEFHLDRETGLPLKSDLINAQGEAIEQLLVHLHRPDGRPRRHPDGPAPGRRRGRGG